MSPSSTSKASWHCKPENGSVWGAAAGIAMDRGDYAKASELLKIAEEKTPGTPQSIIEGARLAFRTEPPEQAADKLKRAIAHIQNNPILMRQSDLALMRKELDELNSNIEASSSHS
jgi:predicted Zn-dependent protease